MNKIIFCLTLLSATTTFNAVLVTGGSGYIGSAASYTLFKAGYQVVILDRTIHNDNIFNWGKIYSGDYGDKEILEKLFSENNIDAVMHIGAKNGVGPSYSDPFGYYEKALALQSK